jgi:hypothetical protein
MRNGAAPRSSDNHAPEYARPCCGRPAFAQNCGGSTQSSSAWGRCETPMAGLSEHSTCRWQTRGGRRSRRSGVGDLARAKGGAQPTIRVVQRAGEPMAWWRSTRSWITAPVSSSLGRILAGLGGRSSARAASRDRRGVWRSWHGNASRRAQARWPRVAQALHHEAKSGHPAPRKKTPCEALARARLVPHHHVAWLPDVARKRLVLRRSLAKC